MELDSDCLHSALEGMNEDGNGPSSPPQTKSTPATDAKTAD